MALQGNGPETVAVTIQEGGQWIPFKSGELKSYDTVHSIRFANGAEWDVINGWRILGNDNANVYDR